MTEQGWHDWLAPQTIRIVAPRDRVWRSWGDASYLSHWYTDETDGRIGRGQTVTLKFTKFGFEAPYIVRDIDRGKFLSLETAGPGGISMRTDVVLTQDENHTLLTLSNLATGDVGEAGLVTEDCVSGWHLALAILKHYTENYFGRTRTTYFAIKPGVADAGALAAYFADEDRLARWLTRSGAIGDTGDKVALILQNGEPLTGRVLARSKREVLLSWEEIEGVIELKAFEQGTDGLALALRASSWRRDGAPDETRLESEMRAALDRLAACL